MLQRLIPTMSFLQFLNTILLLISTVSERSLITYRVPLSTGEKVALGYSEDALLDFTELTTKYGYNTEKHDVTTDDGYIISLFHMTSNNCSKKISTPVLLFHGALESSDIFLDMGPGRGLAYILSDECYDLWVGNCRGTYYGRAHTTLNPDKDAEFWKFSTDEYGFYDVAAQIDYILQKTGVNKINYVGYSQGGGSFLSLVSERTEYNDKVNLFIGFSPSTRLLNTKSVGYKLFANAVYTLRDFLAKIGIQEIMFKGSIIQTFLEYSCQADKNSLIYKVCENFIYTLDSYHPGAISQETYKILYSHFPAGLSVRVISRYAQSLSSAEFQKYDFGSKDENLAHYGSSTPPIYNLTRVTVPSVLMYGPNDILVAPEDVKWVANQLPNLLKVKEVEDPLWSHLDNVYNFNAVSLVYQEIIDYLKLYS